jgi:hypothetical protein
MEISLERAYTELDSWCRERGYAGYDPFDGLNSKLFQATPLRRSRTARLAWTQLFKRSPLNLRGLARVPVERNPKGTALFALAALAASRYDDARMLLECLCESRIESTSGAAWGYNFDWQGRAFFAARGTPTVVPTAFAVRALIEGGEALRDGNYTQLAVSAASFVLKDLNRSDESSDEVCFSYSPLDRTRVFNASLLAAEILASVAVVTCGAHLKESALRAARYVVRRQRDDGSWGYGADSYQTWCDNFHTAFVLTSLSRIMRSTGSDEFTAPVRRGLRFWRERFFLPDGWPKYYPDKQYPADAHSAGAAIVSLLELRWVDDGADDLAEKVAAWAIRELRDQRGYFHYQRRRFYTVRIPYMRWSQAWMLYGLARLVEERRKRVAGE